VQIEKGLTDNWLQPTGAQEALMRQYAGHKRFVWNRALSIEQARYRRGEKMLGFARMSRELTMWRNNPDPHSNFLMDAPVHALQCALWELYESYRKFFHKEQIHPPRFKKKAKSRISFTESDPASFEIDEVNKKVRLPKPSTLAASQTASRFVGTACAGFSPCHAEWRLQTPRTQRIR
jgi:putative transposase